MTDDRSLAASTAPGGAGRGDAARARDLGTGCLLDATEAGKLLCVPGSWLLRQARDDAIPHVRLGRYVRFDEGDLRAWLETAKRRPR